MFFLFQSESLLVRLCDDVFFYFASLVQYDRGMVRPSGAAGLRNLLQSAEGRRGRRLLANERQQHAALLAEV